MMAMHDIVILGCLLLATAVVPLLLLRRSGMGQRWGIAEAAFWVILTLGISTLRVLEITLPGDLLFAIVFVMRSGLFVGLILSSDGNALRWNAVRAGLAATFVYLILIPHVLHLPIDGDEPYFLLLTESIVQDLDLDLANQYGALAESETGRLDLQPQLGDPVGEEGQLYSRHEPFLSVLMVPGYLVGGLHGAVATIALFGGLMVVSVLKLCEEGGSPLVSRSLVWPAIALAPPVLFYSTRLWTEVPGALAFSEAIRAMQARKWKRFVVWLLVLSLLQLRFGALAIALLVAAVVLHRPSPKKIAVGVAAMIVPFVVLWIATGRPFGVHRLFEILPMSPLWYLRGFGGLIIDAQAGLLFQAPLWLLGLLVFFRGRDRRGVGALWLTAVPYLLLLAPRAEWHGGWSPPLRYVVVLAPLFALGLARVLEWLPSQIRWFASAWTAGLVIHGIAFPWRLFHIASGESVLAEALSRSTGQNFSQALPSLIRFNSAAIVWLLMAITAMAIVARWKTRIPAAALAIAFATGITSVALVAKQPSRIVEMEDAHVGHRGGQLYPERWTVARFRFRGGWSMDESSVATFRMKPGTASIDYSSEHGVTIGIGDLQWSLPPTEPFGTARIEIPEEEVELRVIEGAAVIDRVIHE